MTFPLTLFKAISQTAAWTVLAVVLILGPSLAQEAVERRTLVDLTAGDAQGPTGVAPAQTLPDGESEAAGTEGLQPPSTTTFQSLDARSTGSIALLPDKGPLRIGLMAEHGPSYLQSRIEPFRTYMQTALSRPIEIVAFTAMRSLMAAHAAHQIDVASYPASVFAMAQASCGCLSPLVAPVSSQGPEGIYMLLVVHADSGIKSLADMTGRTMVLSSKDGAVPFHVALNELRRSGLDPDRDLSSIRMEDTPFEALDLLENGAVDAAVVWSTTYFNQTLLDDRGAVAAYADAKTKATKGAASATAPGFLSIWRSRPIPAGPYAVHNAVSKQDRADLIKALTAMNKSAPEAYDAVERYHGAGFKSVTMQDYAPLIEIATAR